MGKKSPKIPINVYKMSITHGICHGIVDRLHRLYVREKVVWSGRHCGPDQLLIDEPEIFGGLKQEGGVQGGAYLQAGTADQLLHPVVATKQGGLPEELPGFRGIATITWTEAGEGTSGGKNNPGFDGPGFYWVAGSPYLPGIWAMVERISRPFLTEKAHIFRELGEDVPGIVTNYCFAVQWDEEIGQPGPQPDEAPWTENLMDYDGDGVSDSRIDHIYGLIAAFCERLVTEGEGSSTVTIHFLKGSGSRNDFDLAVLGNPTRPDSWNHPSFNDNTHFAKVGPFLASAVDTTSGYGSIELPRGSNFGDFSNNATSFGAPSGMFDAILADHDAGTRFSFVFYISEHHEDDRWDKFSSGDPWKYGTGLGGNAEMKADYHRIANAFRGRCIEFRMIAYYDFHIVGATIDPDRVDTTYWDVLYMISGAEAHGTVPWYGPFIDVVHSAEAWHFWHARFHGFSADLKDLGGGYNVEFTNIYSDEATAEFSYSAAFDNGGGAEAWIEYFFASRVGTDIYDANPIHMIVECLTNPTWGMGYPFSALEMSSFRDAACTLFDEQFGLSMMWTQQDTIENFVKEIIDHIEAALYINPETGLFEIKLIRFDYDINQLPRLDPSNMTVKRAATRLVSEATNEITVEWTNPLNEKKETVTIQDLGGVVACNGIIKSETRNYYGIRRVALATEVVRRDIRSASAPITTMEVEVDRSHYNALPAQVFEVVYPEHQIFGDDPLIMRILAADYGKPGASKIILSLSEDVFSLSPHFFDVAPGTELVNVSTPPSEMDDGQVITFPYFFAANAIDAAAASAAVHPDVFVGVLVAEADQGSVAYNLYGDTSDPAGGSTQESFGERDVLAKGTLQAALLWEAETLVSDWGVLSNGTGPIVGGVVLIGDPADDETVRELALISAEASGVWTIKRGVLDTVPRAWAAGTEIWFMSLNDNFEDPETRAAGEMVDYVAQIIATGGVLPVSGLTPIPTYTLTERPHLPSRPADVKVDTVAFADKFYLVKPATVDVTWAGRNRLTETAQILGWTDGGIPVEVGQTVEIEVYDAGLALIHTFTGLTGGTASLDETEFDQAGISTLRFYAKVGTFRSLQYYEVRVDTRGDVGYGQNYGFDYGGT